MRRTYLIPVLVLFMGITVRASDLPPRVGDHAPEFSGRTADGREIKLSDYRGKVVLLDFWASWCGPCREEMPFLVEFYRIHRKQAFQVVAVNLDRDRTNVNAFLSRLDRRPAFPILMDRDQKIPASYDIEAMPTTIFIDKEGTIRFRHNGFKKSHEEMFRAEVEKLLQETRGGS